MTLIQRQDALVAKLEPLYVTHFRSGWSALGQDTIGKRSKAKRLHREELIAAGYSQKEAMESADQCDAVARRNADHQVFVEQIGGAA